MVRGIVRGKKSTLPKDKSKTLGGVFLEQAEKNGDKIFQIDADTDSHDTFAALKKRSVPIAVSLRELGVNSQDVVMLCCKNNSDNIVPALAAWYIGARVASVDPKQEVSDVKICLAIVEPKVVFVVEDSLRLVEDSLVGSDISPRIIVIGKSAKYKTMAEMERADISDFKLAKVTGDDVAVILFSSGTTSVPKGICISHYSLLYGARGLVEHNSLKPSMLMHFTSTYWASAVMLSGLCMLDVIPKVIGSRIDGERLLQLIEKYKISYIFSSGTLSYLLTDLDPEIVNKYDTSSLYSYHMGGSTMDPQQLLRLRKLLKHTNVAMTFGTSEVNYAIAFDHTNAKAYLEKVSSSGTPLPDVELKFVDVDTREPVGPNQQGEMLIRTPYMLSGFYKLEKPDSFDDEGFLKQGDLGYYDDDGYIYITDRISETFKYRTFHVSPSLIEEVFLQHPSVREAVVFGVAHPVDMFHPAACVVPKKDSDIDVDELIDFVNARVSDSHQIRGGVKMVGVLPKTPTGKIQRRTVKEDFLKSQN
ncbi:luciferin 4-monooxygenase-like [Cylas formicarius]|uniref:luciferin 4-monooxygenase-like n=1 Tax=Cylas formicarius TaxID=197179 RepID=UPI002958C06F|nr:luciferin 4-monooxygenase-like [Cylas formicarius]